MTIGVALGVSINNQECYDAMLQRSVIPTVKSSVRQTWEGHGVINLMTDG
jgi:hypothetical protein